MGCTFLLLSLFIYDTGDADRKIAAIRFHDLNRFPHRKFISLFDPAHPVFQFSDDPQIRILFYIRIAVINLRLFIRLSKKESRRKLPVSAV